ncbi:MAG TPA: NUDIX domain-containing protein [Tepidisphaeraceae bacterium]|jgi:mutator protein MutT
MPSPDSSSPRAHGVVVAIERDGKFLCIRRAKNLPRAPGKVCFPGGMIEPGESQEQAVIREMKEELGIDVEPIRQCWRHDLPNKHLTLWGWIANWTTGQITPAIAEVEESFWLTPDEICSHPDAIDTNPLFVRCLLQNKK